jgi:hypothetical protein
MDKPVDLATNLLHFERYRQAYAGCIEPFQMPFDQGNARAAVAHGLEHPITVSKAAIACQGRSSFLRIDPYQRFRRILAHRNIR